MVIMKKKQEYVDDIYNKNTRTMTTEEAIKIISECPNCKKLIDGECNEETGECFEAKRMAIEALEKQIQEKPIGSGIEFLCPRCLTTVGHIKKHGGVKITHTVCPNCGQKLDWKEK